jgi:hypothetical protein
VSIVFGLAESNLVWASPDKIERKKSIFSPSTLSKVHFSSLNFKTGQTIFLNFLNRAFYGKYHSGDHSGLHVGMRCFGTG